MHLHIDPPAGMAGDMILSALVDVGAEIESIHRTLHPLASPEMISFQRVCRRGITGTALKDHEGRCKRILSTSEEAAAVIGSLDASESVRESILRMFRFIYEAESAIHGSDLDSTHLHELAALDTLVDIAGIAAALRSLDVTSCSVGPIPFGRGTVRTEHGLLPVPAPATAKLLEGFEVYQGDMEGEATTPTAAAVVREIVNTKHMPSMTMERTGYGFGSREGGELPNAVRVFLGHTDQKEQVYQLEANMDDMTGQLASRLLQKLFDNGVLDAHFKHLTMKKGRPGIELTVLFPASLLQSLLDTVFAESTTIGVRYFPVQRVVLERRLVPVEIPEGTVSVKVAVHGGRVVNAAPEFSEAEAVAEKSGKPVKEIIRKVLQAYGGEE